MSTPILLVATATQWLGAARIPRPLVEAGFEVALLAPKNSLAEKSRFVGRVGHLPDNATPREWLYALAAMVKASSPRIIIPCDDMAVRLLQTLVLSPPQYLQPALHLELAALIRESLGEPQGYRASIDKALLPAAAEALGVRVAPYAPIAELADAEAFAAAQSYPVVLKRSYSTAGDGVAICGDRAELGRAFAELTRTGAHDLEGARGGGLLAQAHVDGRIAYYPASAWKGVLLTGYAAEKLVGNPEPKGPATVNRYHRSPPLREIAVKIAAGFGMSGLFSLECIVDAHSGVPCLLEINRRVVPNAHRGSSFNVDCCAALFAAVHGKPLATRADFDEGEEYIGVHFPQEWLRDPGSLWLRDHPVDVPWEEPELIEAMLALRQQR